jgi:hypothetical protein
MAGIRGVMDRRLRESPSINKDGEDVKRGGYKSGEMDGIAQV